MAISVLFVCLGNICRSPTAHGVMETLVKQSAVGDRIFIDSAGTGAWHTGNPPDARSVQVAQSRGYELGHLRARKVTVRDFEQFDYILAMDRQNLQDLERLCPAGFQGHLGLFLEFARRDDTNITAITEVPDPYYGGADGFEQVLDLVEQAAAGLLAEIEHRLT